LLNFNNLNKPSESFLGEQRVKKDLRKRGIIRINVWTSFYTPENKTKVIPALP
jgi:hypothetical protein